jgi:RecA-family ATPase
MTDSQAREGSSGRRADDRKLELVNGEEICKMEFPPAADLIRNIIREQSVNFLAGEEGSGKSLISMNLACSIVAGKETFLSYELAKSGKVLYLNTEMAFDDFGRRLQTMSTAVGGGDCLKNLIVPKQVPLLNECWQELNQICRREGPCLIVVDCLYFAHGEDESDNSKMKQIMRQFLSLRDSHKLAVLVVHHTKKGSRKERMHNDLMRGAGAFGGAADTVLMLRPSQTEPGNRIILPTKLRHSGDSNKKARLLSFDEATFWFTDEGDAKEEEHILAPVGTAKGATIDLRDLFNGKPILTREAIGKAFADLGLGIRTADRRAKKAVKDGVLVEVTPGVYSLPVDIDNPIAKS